MEISNDGLARIMVREGFSSTAYQCGAGVWTIGYGHTKGVRRGDKVSTSFAREYLKEDCAETYPAIMECRKDWEQWEFDALVSLVLNIGSGAFRESTLFKRLQQYKHNSRTKKAWLVWHYINGVESKGLENRRLQEWQQFEGEV